MIIFKILAAIIVAALVMVLLMGVTAAFTDEETEHGKEVEIVFAVLVIAIWILMSIAFAALII